MNKSLRLLLALCLGLLAHSVLAQSTQPFASLQPEIQRTLSPFQQEWDTFDAATQQRMLRGAERWAGMSSSDRAAAAKRMTWWRALPEARQAEIRRSFESFKALPPTEQQRIRQAFKRFKNLPPERRAELMQRFERMNTAEREAFMLGAQGRAGIPWRELWGPISRADVRETIAMTRSLEPRQRQRLAELAGQTAVADRDALRRRVIAMSFAERAAFLDQ